MASLLPTKTAKAEAPRNANEAAILRAREGMANGDRLWASGTNAKKADDAPARPITHLSSPDQTTMKGLSPVEKTDKTDVLTNLPQAVRRRAEALAPGQQRFLALLHQRHAATGQPVSFSTADAATVMDLPKDRAAKTVESLEVAGLIARRHNSLGGLAGYVPGNA